MSILFSESAFARSVKNQQSDWNAFCNKVTQKMPLSHAKVSLNDYSKEYCTEGWQGRKIVALPKALIGVVGETATFVANTVFDALQNCFSDHPKSIKAHCFIFIRGLEGVLGQILTLFHDRVGSYLVDDARFHQECYRSYGLTLPTPEVRVIEQKETDTTRYESPLAKRYASKEMSNVFSEQTKFSTWRQLWLALAEAEQELGLDITDEQLEEMRAHLDDINYETAEAYEKELHHDVMAHIKAWGEQCPKAAKIIHLGATSMYPCDNTELIQMRKGMELMRPKLHAVIGQLADLAEQYKDTPCLAQTHFQAAQPTTVGKRITLWLENFVMDYNELNRRIDELAFLGSKGATGTQASFLSLFKGDHDKVIQLEKRIAEKMGFSKMFPVTGQTYPRKQDLSIMQMMTQMSVSAHKLALDMRVLAHDKEMEEPFAKSQIGSSAMAYKRNPMYSERICALSRFVRNLENNAGETASWQMLERTLDDSANRRIIVPEGFLAMDGILSILMKITKDPVVYEKTCEKHIQEELPFMATENILMYLVEKKGKSRQEMHEKIRVLSQQAAQRVKMEAKENNLLTLILEDPEIGLTKEELDSIMDVKEFIGRAPQQVEEYLRDVVRPLLQS